MLKFLILAAIAMPLLKILGLLEMTWTAAFFPTTMLFVLFALGVGALFIISTIDHLRD